MFKKFLENFNKLPTSNKSMVYLSWINSAWAVVSWLFVNIYVFNLQKSIIDVITYNIVFFAFCFLWFSALWIVMSIFKKDIKNMYYIWYIFFIIAFLLLFLFNWSHFWIYLFSCIFAFWTWAFWCAVHTQELKNIENKNRDFYSSSISAWRNIILIIMPIFIWIIFYISHLFNIDWYKILFLTLPIIYLSSFLFIKNIDNYIPKKIRKSDLKNFFNLKKYKYWHLYFAIWWFALSLYNIFIPILSIEFLKTEMNVSLFQAILTIISTTVIVHLSHKRHHENRLKYFLRISILLALNYLFLWLFLWTLSFIIFSFLNLFLSPIYRVSEHVYDLSLMDNIKTENSDFFPAMILREFILNFWRIFILVVLFIIFQFLNNEILTLKIAIFLTSVSFIIVYFLIHKWEKNEKDI